MSQEDLQQTLLVSADVAEENGRDFFALLLREMADFVVEPGRFGDGWSSYSERLLHLVDGWANLAFEYPQWRAGISNKTMGEVEDVLAAHYEFDNIEAEMWHAGSGPNASMRVVPHEDQVQIRTDAHSDVNFEEYRLELTDEAEDELIEAGLLTPRDEFTSREVDDVEL